MSKFYITTAISYVNAPPHLGHAWELLTADVIARYHRLIGDDVFFLTGTDEHGVKVYRSAEKAGKSVGEHVDENAAHYQRLAEVLNSSNDRFIRTTEKKHAEASQEFWWKVMRNNDIYQKDYEDYYCTGCESFKTKKELKDDCCLIHGTPVELVSEKNYFFSLSDYQAKLQTFYQKHPDFVHPATRFKELKNVVDGGLKDVSISRPTSSLKWGIPVPEDDEQVIYVWFDALINYLTGVGYPNPNKTSQWWPADVHIIGKEILRFHAALWPAMLLAAGFDQKMLPKQILVHGHITHNGEKMSKTKGNVVDPFELIEKQGLDQFRYFFLREAAFVDDLDYSAKRYQERYNSDLANELGNIVQRVLTMLHKYNNGKVPADQELPKKISEARWDSWKTINESIIKAEFKQALRSIWRYISILNKYIDEEKPWELAKQDPEKLNKVLSILAESTFELSLYLRPFLPDTAKKITELFGVEYPEEKGAWQPELRVNLEAGTQTKEPEPLFPRS